MGYHRLSRLRSLTIDVHHDINPYPPYAWNEPSRAVSKIIAATPSMKWLQYPQMWTKWNNSLGAFDADTHPIWFALIGMNCPALEYLSIVLSTPPLIPCQRAPTTDDIIGSDAINPLVPLNRGLAVLGTRCTKLRHCHIVLHARYNYMVRVGKYVHYDYWRNQPHVRSRQHRPRMYTPSSSVITNPII
jgi:hypothetical protein